MKRKLGVGLITLILVLSSGLPVNADLSVGVQKGNWIEYSVTYTGSPSQDHTLDWARIDVTDVRGTDIYVSITSRYTNGSSEVFNSTLNLKTGHLIDDFIIPANLKTGDSFLDQNQGNITISHTEQHTYAGALRTVISASKSQNTYVWDQATGVSLEGTSEQTDYSMHTIVEVTNMWHPSTGLNLSTLVFITIAAVLVTVMLVAMAVWFRKKRTLSPHIGVAVRGFLERLKVYPPNDS
jgi:hypothetical protein